MRTLIFLLLAVLLAGMPAAAQDGQIVTEGGCTPDGVRQGMQDVFDTFSPENADDVLEFLRTIRNTATMAEVHCTGNTFSSERNGEQPVLGPIYLASGVWRVRVVTDGYMIADIETLTGTCENTAFGTLYNITAGRAATGAERLIRSTECVMLLTVGNTNQAWELELEQIQ